jgi:hypothetical protein
MEGAPGLADALRCDAIATPNVATIIGGGRAEINSPKGRPLGTRW